MGVRVCRIPFVDFRPAQGVGTNLGLFSFVSVLFPPLIVDDTEVAICAFLFAYFVRFLPSSGCIDLAGDPEFNFDLPDDISISAWKRSVHP